MSGLRELLQAATYGACPHCGGYIDHPALPAEAVSLLADMAEYVEEISKPFASPTEAALLTRYRELEERAAAVPSREPQDAAPGFRATPTEGGASPEGNDGEPGAAVPSREAEGEA